ncbi:MAG: Asp-tRNA(Asn)/Glu-tRNA(Gln) amidotransferase subunit GatC [Chloroflexi bacterium]|nr:Asp-tRNA(Asn)/Glu-tRNA(Gln) amidotransferase subunit GatC [Chloroflexota bacterium]
MALSHSEVWHIARLARIGLSDAEADRLREQLSTILEHFQSLNAYDTDGVPPTAQTFDLTTVERADEPRPTAGAELVLANAPRREGDFLRVRAVLE